MHTSRGTFLTSALDGVEWSASRPGRTLAPVKGRLMPIGWEAGWVWELVWTQRLEEKSFASVGVRNQVVQSVVRHHTDWASCENWCIYCHCLFSIVSEMRDLKGKYSLIIWHFGICLRRTGRYTIVVDVRVLGSNTVLICSYRLYVSEELTASIFRALVTHINQ
jgi:hypothetical protein